MSDVAAVPTQGSKDRPEVQADASTWSTGSGRTSSQLGEVGSVGLAPSLRTRLAAALTLAVLAPFVGEYLLGNVPVQELWALPILGPLYGGGALLIRELAVRLRLDALGVLLLGAAYGLIEAGLVDQSLFSPSFEGLEFQAVTPVPLLGISAHAALGFVAGHAIFSIGVPIALTGLLFPATRNRPLTGPVGLALVVALYAAGCWLVFREMLSTEGFMATPMQRLGALAGVLLLVGAALRREGRDRPAAPPGYASDRALTGPDETGEQGDHYGYRGTRAWGSAWHPPAPLWVGLLSFLACGLDMSLPETWTGVALMAAWLAAAGLVVPRFARHQAWTARHTLALAAGALLTFAWVGFVLASILAPGDVLRHVGNAGFALVAVTLLLGARRRIGRMVG